MDVKLHIQIKSHDETPSSKYRMCPSLDVVWVSLEASLLVMDQPKCIGSSITWYLGCTRRGVSKKGAPLFPLPNTPSACLIPPLPRPFGVGYHHQGSTKDGWKVVRNQFSVGFQFPS